MRKLLKLFLLLAVPFFAGAQTRTVDSLKQALQMAKQDTSRVLLLNALSRTYLYSRPDTTLALAQQGLLLANKRNFARGEAGSLDLIAAVFLVTGNYPKALQLNLKALKKAEAINDQVLATGISLRIGNTYAAQEDYYQAVAYLKKVLAMAESLHLQRYILISLLNLGDNYEKLNRLDSALSYTNQAFDLAVQQKAADHKGFALLNLGNI